MSSYSIPTSISQYGAEDNLLFSNGKSQREMILMIIMSDNNRHGTSKETDTVEQSDSSIFYNTKRNVYFQEKKNIKWIPTLLFWAMQGNVPFNSSWLLAC